MLVCLLYSYRAAFLLPEVANDWLWSCLPNNYRDNTSLIMAIEQGTKFRTSVRVRIWNEQDGFCLFCGRKCKQHAGNKADDAFTVDHKVRKRDGGKGIRENGRGLCAKCHRRLNNKELTQDGRPRGPKNRRGKR